MQYTVEQLIDAVKNSLNFCQVCRQLGIKHTGGNSYERIRNKIKELKIDTSHFLGQKTKSGKLNSKSFKSKPIELVLTDNVPNRQSHKILKNAMIKSDVIYECSECHISKWCGKTITLDIDHIDGDWSNCKLVNLRFLCPNCHRQTNTFGGKNKN